MTRLLPSSSVAKSQAGLLLQKGDGHGLAQVGGGVHRGFAGVVEQVDVGAEKEVERHHIVVTRTGGLVDGDFRTVDAAGLDD